MTKPTLEQIDFYCQQKHPNVDAIAFFLHYESNGWMVGKVPMKNWRAAVALWDRMGFRFNGGNGHASKRDQDFAAAFERSREADREAEMLFKPATGSSTGIRQGIQANDRGVRGKQG